MSVILIDGSVDWSGGVDSVKVTTIQSEMNPNGLARNELAWLDNGTVRDGGISPRFGWSYLFDIADGSARYQGGFLYDPTDDSPPYLITCIGGELFWVDIITGIVTNLSTPTWGAGGNTFMMPATAERIFFCQAEEFLVMNAGDYLTLPLIWFGTNMNLIFQSMGPAANPALVVPGVGGVSQIPPAGPMDYYMGRLWYARGRQYGAGDLVGGPSGTTPYNLRNSIFELTENPLCVSGLDFVVPSQAGNIRALKHSSNINTQLGQGLLYIFTRRSIYSQEVPISRSDWIAAGNQQAYDFTTGVAIPTAHGDMPIQKVVQMVNGSVNDLSIVPVNGDLFYQSLEPGIRSLVAAIRNYEELGNKEISAPMYRLTKFNDRELMRFASGIQFSNRLLETQLPQDTQQGVISKALAVMDFIPLSTNKEQKAAIWEGGYEGLDILQLFEGDFGGRQRAFAIARATDLRPQDAGKIQLWEITDSQREDFNVHGDSRITMVVEFPAYVFGDQFKLKKLVSGELWFDRLIGTVEIQVQYRVDGDHCWNQWHLWQECSAKNQNEDMPPVAYPSEEHCESYRWSRTLPLPPASCQIQMRRPMNVGYQFQPRIVIKGSCRIRGFLLKAEHVEDSLYSNIVC